MSDEEIGADVPKDEEDGGDAGEVSPDPTGTDVESTPDAPEDKPDYVYDDHLKPQPIEEELKTSYLDYSMSVIVGRAIPDVRDGLKPVHRRILYAMKELGVTASSAYKKSARTVGEVLGKFHPHGDSAVYDAMVRMAQDFSLRYPLVDGQGNFGSVDGDGAAAMRYTEARLARISNELLEDLDKETVDWTDNFDGTLQEPSVLPGKLPNLLLNGSDGIAVGMATKIPPHNLTEICDAIVSLIDDPEVTIPDLMQYVKGPDFPTGGLICGTGGIYSAYMTGRGRVVVRARTEVEERPGDKEAIIVTELPYQVNKANLLISIANLIKEKRIEGISDLRDESDRHGMRVVIELKRGIVTDLVLNQLFAHTQMQNSFGVLNLVLHHGQPKVMDLKETLTAYLDHREEVVVRRTEFDLRKAEEKLHILEGLLIALDNIDAVIELIRRSADPDVARTGLMEKFSLSEMQAKAILDMRLSKLTSLEVDSVRKDHEETSSFIERCKEILADRDERLKIVRDEVVALREKYGDERRSEILDIETDVVDEDLIPREDVIVTMTRSGYIKRMSLDTYRAQNRGGKGLRGMKTKDEDEIVDLFMTHSHDWVMFFTDKGKVYWLKGYRIPEGSRQSKGKAIVNLLEGLENDETILAAIPTADFPDDRYVVFATRKGTVKRTQLSAYKNVRTAGIKAIVLEHDDTLVNVRFTDGTKLVMMASKNGQACLFREDDARPMGRVTRGVRGMKLRKGDEVVSMAVFDAERYLAEHGGEAEAAEVDEEEPEEVETDAEEEENGGMDPAGGPYVLVMCENGYGKATPLTEYRLTKRGGLGVKNVSVTGKTGPVVAIRAVYGDEDLLLTTASGMVVRIRVAQVKVTKSRATQGVIIMRLGSEDAVQAIALLPGGEETGLGDEGDPIEPGVDAEAGASVSSDEGTEAAEASPTTE